MSVFPDGAAERVAGVLAAYEVGFKARPDEALSRDEAQLRQAQRNIIEQIRDALDGG